MKLFYRDVQHAIVIELLRRFRDAGIELAYRTQTPCLRPTGSSTSTELAACQT